MAPAAAAAAAEEGHPRPMAATTPACGAGEVAPPPLIPVIDLASYPFASDPPAARARLARDLRDACEAVGFFYLDNHGVPVETIDRALAASRAFFALPDAQKSACRASAATKNRGWTPPEAERLDPARQKARGDLKEGFYVGREVGADSRMASLPLHGPNVWPSEDACPGFRAACEAYQSAVTDLAWRLLPAVADAAAVGSPDDFLAAVFGEHGGEDGEDDVPFSSGPMAFVRLLSYLPEDSNAEAGVLGCGAHSDWGMLTFLLTDGSPGLQVLWRSSDGSGGGGGDKGDDGESYWQDVPPRPGSFVVNVGDMLERWTGGRMRSAVHRVVIPKQPEGDGTGELRRRRRRQSIAFFLDPSFSALITPPAGSGGEEKYAPVRAGEYLLQRYRATHDGFTY